MSCIAMIFLLASVIGVAVDGRPGHQLNTVRPLHAVGVGIDSDEPGKIRRTYDRVHARAFLESGLGNLTYRLYTELSVQDWHWNSNGAYSDRFRKQGYWIGSPVARGAIVDSFGYRLPHRGSTRDQGDDAGYSRIDDGDSATYWKSNPYLTQAYTHEPDAAHPQWVVVDLDRARDVDAIRIRWADPYATSYAVQYWTGGDAILAQGSGAWHSFEHGRVVQGKRETVTLRLDATPVRARFVRILMSGSSRTCDTHGLLDVRNCVGYAIDDIALGRYDGSGRFHDLVRRARCGGNPSGDAPCARRQTTVVVSSTDPWHRAADRVREGQDQAGFDVIARSPIARGMPVLYPVPLFYSTPANAAAEITYLEARRYPISAIELGEEVDGQYATPEDYGTLYLQWARAIHAVDPRLRLGGPVFQGVNADIKTWPDAQGATSWFGRFLHYLRKHDALQELAFMSFEHYPFAGCDRGATLRADLAREGSLVRGIVATWRADGLPATVPLYITEGNFSSDGGPVPQQLAGALWWTDYIGSALSSGVSRVYHYQAEAEPQRRALNCARYGNYSLFLTAPSLRIRARAAQFYAAQMVTQHWLRPGDEPQRIFKAVTTAGSERAVRAYAALRSDGAWSLLLVNTSRMQQRIDARFATPDGLARFAGPVTRFDFGPAQYQYSGRSASELPRPGNPPLQTVIRAASTYALPADSIVVLRGLVRKASR